MNIRDYGDRVLIAWRADAGGCVCNGKNFADLEALYDYQRANFPDWAITLNDSPAERARLDDNPYLAPTSPCEGAEPAPASREFKTLGRCVLLYVAAFAGAVVGTILRRGGLSPLDDMMPTVFGSILGLAIAIVWLHWQQRGPH